MKTNIDVDQYINNAPFSFQNKLKQIRKVIIKNAPNADEKLSYGMPYYGYKGRLAYFAYAKNHIGLYLIPPIIENNKNILKEYQTSKSTIRFPLNKDLPLELIKKLIKESVIANEIKKELTLNNKNNRK